MARAYIQYRDQRARLREQAASARKPKETVEFSVEEDGKTTGWDGEDLRARIRFGLTGLDLQMTPEQIEEELRQSLYSGMPAADLKQTIILNAKALMQKDADFARFAARILLSYIYEEVLDWDILRDGIEGLRKAHKKGFVKFINRGIKLERLDPRLKDQFDLKRLADELDPMADLDFDYLGIQTLYDRYLIVDKSATAHRRLETPQYLWMRVAMGLHITPDRVIRKFEVGEDVRPPKEMSHAELCMALDREKKRLQGATSTQLLAGAVKEISDSRVIPNPLTAEGAYGGPRFLGAANFKPLLVTAPADKIAERIDEPLLADTKVPEALLKQMYDPFDVSVSLQAERARTIECLRKVYAEGEEASRTGKDRNSPYYGFPGFGFNVAWLAGYDRKSLHEVLVRFADVEPEADPLKLGTVEAVTKNVTVEFAGKGEPHKTVPGVKPADGLLEAQRLDDMSAVKTVDRIVGSLSKVVNASAKAGEIRGRNVLAGIIDDDMGFRAEDQAFLKKVDKIFEKQAKERAERTIELYRLYKSRRFCSSTPTLFNSGTIHSQLSSCYLYTIADSIESIMQRGIADNAYLCKWAGGLGGSWTAVRGMGSYIRGTNGESQGVIPFLRVHNAPDVPPPSRLPHCTQHF